MSEAPLDFEKLLVNYAYGGYPHGAEGRDAILATLTTDIVNSTDENVRRDLTDLEMNELLVFSGWNQWDLIAYRSSEGESGLIPRQEYEAFSMFHIAQTHGDICRTFIDELGIDGLIDLGATARREVGTKVNQIHAVSEYYCFMNGRGIGAAIGATDPTRGLDDLKTVMQWARAVEHGMFGGGPIVASMRDYSIPVLGEDWLTRFRDERVDLSEPERRSLYARAVAALELLSFMSHTDNRLGVADSGPYWGPDGEFTIVRDLFLYEDQYYWTRAAWDLPYSLTFAMTFKPDVDMSVLVNDISTIFTEPRDYLKYLTHAAVYARDKWNTPISDLRQVGDEEIQTLFKAGSKATMDAYKTYSAMSRREKIMAGEKTYAFGFLLPFARQAGLLDKLIDEHGYLDLPPAVSEAYYQICAPGWAAEAVPGIFLTAQAHRPVEVAGA